MTPLPTNPKIVIWLDDDGTTILKIASNIAPLPELEVKIVRNGWHYADEAAGKPFQQVFSY
jgi:hypothetical protein